MEQQPKGRNFAGLPKERKTRILVAAIEVFAKNDYKRASTDEIASKAGISKGLLFYYFKNKKTLYLYLAEHLKRMIEAHLQKEVLEGIDDFFELLDYGMEQKVSLMEKMPWVLDFSVRMYYNTDKEVYASVQRYIVSTSVQRYIVSMTNQMYELYFSHIDTTKFREGVDPQQVLRMLIFLVDGYLHWQMISGEQIRLEPLVEEYQKWKQMLIKYAYREEYQQ